MTSLVHAQAEAVALHRPYLYRYALSKLRRAETADEVVQDTLMAALEGQATFRGESALRTWLIGILKHKIVDWQRREARDPLRKSAAHYVDMDSEYEDTADTLFDSAGGWVTPPQRGQTPSSVSKINGSANSWQPPGSLTGGHGPRLLPPRGRRLDHRGDLRAAGHF